MHRLRERIASLAAAEATLVAFAALYAVAVLVTLRPQIVQDSWLTLLGGREIVEHGLPTHERFTVWAQGYLWIDQQWLAQLIFYGLFLVGGLKLVLLTHAGVQTATLVMALAAARSLGGSQRSTVLVAASAIFAAPWALQLRVQTFAGLLFVLVIWLLAADSRSASRRVFLVFPLLALWANIHGTVVLGALLVALYGLTLVLGPRRPSTPQRTRGGILMLGPALAFASPYGLSLADYYDRMLMNPLMSSFVDEWRRTTVTPATALFYLLAFATIWIVARHGTHLSIFERIALFFTLAGGLLAIRAIPWFALTALVILPSAVDQALRGRGRFSYLQRLQRPLLHGTVFALLGSLAFVASRPASWYTREWPRQALRAIDAASRNPSVRVFADSRHADWILWELPHLAGRVAYDIRFELLAEPEFRALFKYRNQLGSDWRKAVEGYRVLTFDPRVERKLWQAARSEPRARVVYDDATIGVITRTLPTSSSRALTTRLGRVPAEP